MILKIILYFIFIQSQFCNKESNTQEKKEDVSKESGSIMKNYMDQTLRENAKLKNQQEQEEIKKQFEIKIQDEIQQLEKAREIQRQMETEEHKSEIEVLTIFQDLILSKVAVVSNITQNTIENMFISNRITQISKYKDLKCSVFNEESTSFKLKDLYERKKKIQVKNQHDNLYQQLEKANNDDENSINKIDNQKILDELHQSFSVTNLDELENIDIIHYQQTKEEALALNYRKKQKKNDISSISLDSTESSQQDKDDNEGSDEENQQGKLEIQQENEIDVNNYINVDKSKYAEEIVWDPSEQMIGFQDYFKDKDEFNQYVGQKHIDKFEMERQIDNEIKFLKMLKNNPERIQNAKDNIQNEKTKILKLQNKFILDMDLKEFMDISAYTIRKLYEEEKLKNKLDKLNKNQQPTHNNINEQNQYQRIENKGYQDFIEKHNNDIDQAEKEQNFQNQKKSNSIRFIDLINREFYKKQQGNKKAQKCTSKFKYQFLKKPKIIDKNPIFVQQTMKQYCPSLIKSCCTEQELEYLFQKAQKSVEKPIDELSNMELFFKFLRQTPIKTWKQFIIKNNKKIRDCLPQNPAILLKSLIFMQKNYTKIMKTYTQILQNTTENLYSFYCSTCNLYSQNYFQYNNRKYFLNMNQKEITNFQKIQQNSFLMHSIYAMSYFFECFQFNMHLNKQEIMSFILPNSFLSFSATQNEPLYFYYKSEIMRQYFDENYFLYSKKLILWGNLLKLIQDTLNGNRYQQRLHIFIEKSLIQPFSNNYTRFNLSNIQLQISKGNKGNIMQFNKVNSNNQHFKKQKDIIKNMIEKITLMKCENILSIILLILFFIFN